MRVMKIRNVFQTRSEAHGGLANYAALPLRLIVGYGFLAHGVAKWSKGPAAFTDILRAAGVPASQLMAWATIGIEILSGIAILAGAFVSLVSIPAIILLAVAIVTVHLPYGFTSIKLVSFSNGRRSSGLQDMNATCSTSLVLWRSC